MELSAKAQDVKQGNNAVWVEEDVGDLASTSIFPEKFLGILGVPKSTQSKDCRLSQTVWV